MGYDHRQLHEWFQVASPVIGQCVPATCNHLAQAARLGEASTSWVDLPIATPAPGGFVEEPADPPSIEGFHLAAGVGTIRR